MVCRKRIVRFLAIGALFTMGCSSNPVIGKWKPQAPLSQGGVSCSIKELDFTPTIFSMVTIDPTGRQDQNSVPIAGFKHTGDAYTTTFTNKKSFTVRLNRGDMTLGDTLPKPGVLTDGPCFHFVKQP